MYCKNCGNEINPNAIVCLSCGCDPKKWNKYCNNCGVETNSEQIICIKCGSSLNNQSHLSDDDKNVAIIAYLTLIGFIVALIQHSNNKTRLGAYHLRQVVGFMCTGIGFGILIGVLALPMLGMGYRSIAQYAVFIAIISFIISIVLSICVIISLVNAVNGKAKPAPIFGKLYEKWFGSMFDSSEFQLNHSINENQININTQSNASSIKSGLVFNFLILFGGVILLFIPILYWLSFFDRQLDFSYLVLPLLGYVFLYLYSKNKTLSEINLSIKPIYLIMALDIFFKSLSFFSNSNTQEIVYKKIGLDAEFSPEISNTARVLSNNNKHWFSHTYLNDNYEIGSFYKNSINFCEAILPYIILFICLTGLIFLLRFISINFKINSFNKFQKSISQDIRNNIKWEYLKANSIRETILKISSTLLGIIVVINLLASYMLNNTIHNKVLFEVNNSIELSKNRLKFQQDSIKNVELQEIERGKLLTQLVSDITSFYISDSVNVDSAYNVVIQKISGFDNVNEAARNLILTGFKININGPYTDDMYFLSIGEYQDLNNANKAFNLIKPLFPDCQLYYLVKKPSL